MSRVRKRRVIGEREPLTARQLWYLLHGTGLDSFATVADAEAAWRENEALVRDLAGPDLIPWAAIAFDGEPGRFSRYEHLMKEAQWPPYLAAHPDAASSSSSSRRKRS